MQGPGNRQRWIVPADAGFRLRHQLEDTAALLSRPESQAQPSDQQGIALIRLQAANGRRHGISPQVHRQIHTRPRVPTSFASYGVQPEDAAPDRAHRSVT